MQAGTATNICGNLLLIFDTKCQCEGMVERPPSFGEFLMSSEVLTSAGEKIRGH